MRNPDAPDPLDVQLLKLAERMQLPADLDPCTLRDRAEETIRTYREKRSRD